MNNFDPLVEETIRQRQAEKQARLDKQSMLLRKKEEREKRVHEAESRHDAEKYARLHPESQPQGQSSVAEIQAYEAQTRAKIKVWEDEKRLRNMTLIKESFFRPETSPYERQAILRTYSLQHNQVHGTRLTPQDVLDMWREEKRQAVIKGIQDSLKQIYSLGAEGNSAFCRPRV